MPELPEVETTALGIAPHIEQQKIISCTVRVKALRWPIPLHLADNLSNQTILKVWRRGKYLLLETTNGYLIFHLGMSGSLRILLSPEPLKKHDHLDIELANHKILRLNDPRRFGAVLWVKDSPLLHPLLAQLGPEPLSKAFTAKYLLSCAHNKKITMKSFIMDSHIVVGVGNIYATEALFMAGIHPQKIAKQLTLNDATQLVKNIKQILRSAIRQGGTTLRDFIQSNGKPGYFKQSLQVYGREGLPCRLCKTTLLSLRISQRSSVYCPHCQH